VLPPTPSDCGGQLAQARWRGGELVVDWISFRDLAKVELTDLLAQHGWQYLRQEIVGRESQLVFVR
jgi:hypothetical protein